MEAVPTHVCDAARQLLSGIRLQGVGWPIREGQAEAAPTKIFVDPRLSNFGDST